MEDEIQVRRVRKGDGQGLSDTFIRAVYELAVSAYSQSQLDAWTWHITPDLLEVRTMSMISFVAERSNQIIGFISLDPIGREVDFLYVHPTHARRGVGRFLTGVIEREASQRGIEELHLTASLNAVPIYEKLGFSRTENMEKTIGGVTVPCVRMNKLLTGNR